ncbi:ComEC/Rec2 family competence protein [Mesobacillus subterraneus]|uniref:MBL fold metallo-hydrolase n=1 Tax=Mesobacillus subterraneus TaxID=285983 RepID=A0A3R9EC24_9BACI|nr:MBL fold metallo-hydrolase [Mesobacillus subterraneus]
MTHKLIKVITSLTLSISLLFGFSSAQAATKEMKVHFINVGQGDAVYIKTAAGEDILIDAGNKDGSDVVAYLKKQKVKDIEVMIATHPDADHLGGLDEVLHAFKVKSVYAPKVSHTTIAYKEFLTAVKREGLKIKTAKSDVSVPLKGVTAKFVAPIKTYAKSDLNNWSAVLHMKYGKKSFLFTGDAEAKSEADMLKSKNSLKADVLKVGHHGAKTSTGSNFLKAVKPTYAVISVGKNGYGHPTSTIIKRLKAYNIKTYRTDKSGHVIFTTNGSKLSVKTVK